MPARYASHLLWFLYLFLAFGIITPLNAQNNPEPPITTVISVVGPHNLSYLPIDLVPLIKADQAEGLNLRLQHVGGGGLAIKQLITRNSDFAVVGFPAIMSLKAHGGNLVGIAAVTDIPQYSLIVRTKLKDQVRQISDLKGLVIGVHTSAVNAKTVAWQLLELLLSANGLQPYDVRIISSGQDWAKRTKLFDSGQMDAMISEEPFASYLHAKDKAYFLFNPDQPDPAHSIAGIHFLHATLTTRPDVIATQPDKINRLVKALRRSMQWIATHTPEELVEQLQITNQQEKADILLCLQKYPRLFSQDGKFSERQIAETNRFFHSGDPEHTNINMESLINDHWVGRKP